MKIKFKQKLFAIILCIVMIITSVNITNLFETNLNAANTTIDLTGLVTGTDATHTCVFEGKYDANYHWQQCFICNKITGKTAHTKAISGTYHCNTAAYGNRYEYCTNSSCGYNQPLAAKPHTASGLYTDAANYRHYKYCTVCGLWVTGSGGCTNTAGQSLGCGRNGTCVTCGYTYTNSTHGQLLNGKCEKCGVQMLTINTTKTIVNSNTTRILFTVTPIAGLSINLSDAFGSCSGFGTNGTFSNKTYYQSNGIYYIGADLSLNTSINPNGVEFHWYGTYSYNGYTKSCHISDSAKPDYVSPVVNSVNVTGNGTSTSFSRNAKITVSVTDAWNSVNNIVYMRLLDSDNKTVLADWGTASKSGTIYTKTFDVIAEIREPSTIYIQIKDAAGNMAYTTAILQYIDTRSPVLTSNKSYTDSWSKTKDITFKTTDKGIGNVQIGFNNQNDFKSATYNSSTGTYDRTYTFTGDVYGTVTGAVYTKDGLGNISTTKVTIGKLDNTSPTITNVSKTVNNTGKNIASVNLVVTANDLNTILNANGSGVSKYALTTSNTAPTSGWQQSTTFNVTKNGTYYLWAQDLVGNISTAKTINVSEINTYINGTITWDDKSNTHKTRPSSVKIHLYKDGVLEKTQTVTSPWNYTFDNLDMNHVYTVSQEGAESLTNPEDTYKTTQNGYNFTNTLQNYNTDDSPEPIPVPPSPESYQIEGKITWIDNSDKLGLRPYNIELILYQNGIEYSKGIYIVNSKTNSFDYAFTNLEKYDSELNLYKYTVEQKFTSTALTWNSITKQYEEINVYTSTTSDKLNFTNTLINFEDKPIIEVKPDHVNTLNLSLEFNSLINWTKLNKTKEDVNINVILKQMESIISNNNITYSNNYSGIEYNILLNNNDIILNNIPSGKYEINIQDIVFDLENIRLSSSSNMSVVVENGNYYLIINTTNTNNNGHMIITLNADSDPTYNSIQVKDNLYFIK